MLLFSVLLLFLLACAVGGLLVFPGARDFLRTRFVSLLSGLGGGAGRLQRRGVRQAAGLVANSRTGFAQAIALARSHALLTTACAMLVTVPPLVTLLASGRIALPGFDTQQREVNMQVKELLLGERLVPPPVLPPAVFTTAEVVTMRPMLDTADRNWLQLDAEFTQRLLLAFRIMREQHGYEMALLEGYRSPERQNRLADAGPHVSNARAFQSYHQFGLAADCAFLRDGKLVISERDPWAMRGYELYGKVAESLGMTWGGRWTMMDFGHVELRSRRVER